MSSEGLLRDNFMGAAIGQWAGGSAKRPGVFAYNKRMRKPNAKNRTHAPTLVIKTARLLKFSFRGNASTRQIERYAFPRSVLPQGWLPA